MALTPEDIERHTFKVARRGYDKVEVDRFLGQVATSYRELEQQASAAPAAPAPLDLFGSDGPPATSGELFAADTGDASAPAPPAPPVPGAEPEGDDFNKLGSQVADVLRTAHASVATLRHEAEVEAAIIRQRAEQEVAAMRQEAEDYATRVRAEADAYASERANEANRSRRDAERILAEARAKADVHLADTERRIAAVTEQAEANAQARSQELLAEANRRLEVAAGTEAALRERLIAAHGNLNAALAQFAGPEPTDPTPAAAGLVASAESADLVVDLTDDGATPVLDLTEGAAGRGTAGDEPAVPLGWPGAPPVAAGGTDLFGDNGTALATADPVVTTDAPASPADQPDAAPSAIDDPSGDEPDEDPLPAVVRDAIGRAVQSALNRTEDPA